MWRIWAGKGKSDVYVAVRSDAGVFKVSLHESGDCYIGLTTQFAEDNPSALIGRGGSRHFDRWKRRTHSGSQLSIPFRLVFPGSELREVSTQDDQDALVQWIEPPAQDQSVTWQPSLRGSATRTETGRYALKVREWWRRFAYRTAKCSGCST